MKKQFATFAFLFFNCFFSWSQVFVKTTTPCNDELLKKTPGRWMPVGRGFYAKISKQQELEIVNRLNVIHQLVYNIYPSPKAFDAMTFYSTTDQDFASQVKIESSQYGRPNNSYINGTSTICYGYSAKFCDYHCGRETYEIMRGAGCEAGTNITVTINSLDGFLTRASLDDYNMDIMRIDGRQIRMMPVRTGKWKGYDIFKPEAGSGVNMILLHRDALLPFIPVSRKEYLDRSIVCLQKFFDKSLKLMEHPEGLALLQDKKERDEGIKKYQKLRDDVLKYYQDELNATTKAGLLNAPAILFGGIADILTTYPIFTTQDAGGKMLVTENPAYLKKDIPKYIPQFMIYTMWDGQDGPDPALNPYRLFYENFPIEKLKAMIDK